MDSVFFTQELLPVGFFQRLFGFLPKENALIELNNLFSQKAIEVISRDDVDAICKKYRINIHKKFHSDLLRIYRTYLGYCLKDKKLSDSEKSTLKKLKALLNLDDEDVWDIHNEVAKKIYKSEVQKVINDGVLDDEEEQFLRDLEKDLAISHELANNIYKEEAKTIFEKALTTALSDQRLSPEEEKQLSELAANLKIRHTYDPSTQRLLDKYKMYWLIENGDLPTLNVEINLQKGEICHFCVRNIDWNEQRTVSQRIDYSGFSYRLNICKGLSYRVGTINPQRVTSEEWKLIDTGDLYLTNKRIVFMGSKGNKTIPHKKILDFNIYSDGINLQKDSGKSPFLRFYSADIFGIMLGRLMQNAN